MRVLTMAISALALFASVASATPMPDDAGQSLARRYRPFEPPAQSTAPQAGIYVITSMADKNLAITYNPNGTPLTVTLTSESGSLSQRWVLRDETAGQSVKPLNAIGLEAVRGEDSVLLRPSTDFVWNIKETANGYTIQDTGEPSIWGLASVTEDARVTLGASTGGVTQKWRFDKVG